MNTEVNVVHQNDKRKLEGKVIIITGGASGIDEATARLFAHHGSSMIVIADIQDKKGQDVVASIGPQTCSYVSCDITDEAQVESMINYTVKTYGRLDIMFSNAGIINHNGQTILDIDLSAYDRLMAINARGMVACAKHAGKAMVDGGVKGSIVCTGSVVASTGSDSNLEYVMSKHAVLGLVRSASLQLGKYGIRVNCVSPSAVGTPMMCSACGTDVEGVEKMFTRYCSLQGEGLALKVNHVADAVLFLASDDSAFITGHNLAVDGGFRRY
ncbi:hypothetical protein MKW94_022902 [Papaver nudicaule]|uniref:Secoisolariciresinol dehydrogenase n=1 Tax=Papaver nudicaule TaxID=74823 RepID=A0AA41VVN3_PAPNU|nr:hypothetical protein [Papaver nudicaule]